MKTNEDAQNRILLPAERRQDILEILRRDGKALASELAVSLGISEDTVRRDLKELAEAGLLQRVHGGALPRSPVPLEHAGRSGRDTDAKRAIGKAAATLVGPTDSVLLGGGTTNLEVARALPSTFRGTLLTINLHAALALAENPHAEVIVLGGRLHKPALDCIGSRVIAEVTKVRADVCFIGAASLDPDFGISSLDYEESQTERALIAAASRIVAVLSTEKLNTASPFLVAGIDEIDCLVTDRHAPPEILDRCRAHGIEVVVA